MATFLRSLWLLPFAFGVGLWSWWRDPIRRAARHRNRGRYSEALAILEGHVDWTSADYDDRKKGAARLAAAFDEDEAEERWRFVGFWIATLEPAGRPEDALGLAEGHLEVDLSLDRDPAAVVRDLEASWAGMPSELATLFRMTLSYLMLRTDRSHWALLLTQQALEIDDDDLEDRRRLQDKLLEKEQAWSEELFFAVVMAWMQALDHTRRHVEMLRVIETVVNLEEADYEHPVTLIRKLEERFDPHYPGGTIVCLQVLTLALMSAGRKHHVVSLLETYLDFDPRDLDNLDAVMAKMMALAEKAQAPPELVMVFFFQSFMMICMERAEDIAPLVGELGAMPDVSMEELETMVEMFESAPGEGRERQPSALLALNLSVGLSGQMRFGDAARLLERLVGIKAGDETDSESLAEAVARRFRDYPEFIPLFVATLAENLEFAEDDKKLEVVLDAYFHHLSRIETHSGHFFYLVRPVIRLHRMWFEHRGRDEGQAAWRAGQSVVEFLRRGFVGQGETLEDREAFLADVAELRRVLLGTGYFWAMGEVDSDSRARRLLEAQLWAAELDQRLLMERFRFGVLKSPPPGDAPARDWPFAEDSTALSTTITARHAAAGFLEVSGSAADVGGAEIVAEAVVDSTLEDVDQELLLRLDELITGGVDEELLMSGLGPSGLWVRATFDLEGGLLWTAIRGGQGALRVVQAGSGQPGDLDCLRWAAARHDLRLALTRLDFKARGRAAISTRQELAAAVRRFLTFLEQRANREGASRELADLYSSVLEECRDSTRGYLELGVGQLAFPPSRPFEFQRWAATARIALRELLPYLAPSGVTETSLAPALDAVTEDYLARVGEIWPLDSLAEALSPDCDVVFQVDDALHAVPLAHLSILGEPLYRRVASVRSSVSMLFERIQQESEETFANASGDEEGLLCVSHFEPLNEAESCAPPLHRRQSELAQHHGLVSAHAAENPPGAAGVIRHALLQEVSWRAVTVCGHGHASKSGIGLADGLWRGDGCDFRGVGWLLLLSCSIGRVAQTGDYDVEGFCIDLAKHRAFSIVACRWPVNGPAAVALGNRALALHLEEAHNRDGPCARARALNAARRALLEDPRSSVGLHTAAAFELYGLG